MIHTTTTTTVLRPFVRDYPGEPVPEETLTHPPSWSSSNLYQLIPSTTIHSILPVQITCLAIFLHNLFPCPLWSASWCGALHLIFHTFLHPISVFFLQHLPIIIENTLSWEPWSWLVRWLFCLMQCRPPLIRVNDRVSIPQEEHPEINFVGLLIGPRGNTLRNIEKEVCTVSDAVCAHISIDLTVICWLDLASLWLYCVLQFVCVWFSFLWSPYIIGQTIIFLPCDFYFLSSFFLFFLA